MVTPISTAATITLARRTAARSEPDKSLLFNLCPCRLSRGHLALPAVGIAVIV